LRGEIPEWTGEIKPKLHHNTPEGKREAFLRRPLVEPSIVPTGPLPSREQQEEWERQRRLEYVKKGIEKGYPLLEDPHDRRIFKTPKPIDNFLPIALKHLTVHELLEAVKPKYYGDIRYKPKGEYVPPKEEPEVARYPEPAPSTAAPAAADTSSEEEEEEEEVLQLAVSKEEIEELTGVAAAIARSTSEGIEAAIVRATLVDKPPPPSARGRGRGVRPLVAPPSTKGFGRGILSSEAQQAMVGRGRASNRGKEPRDM
jgi:hypothetical protein